MNRPLLEICVASVAEAQTAESAGADRLELNSGLQLGGLTPSAMLTTRVLSQCSLPVIAMARPRPGGFCYDKDDWETLVADSIWLDQQGVTGIAFGCLNADRSVDLPRVRQIRQQLSNSQLIFHRAFDLVSDWKTAIDQLANSGVDRIMTSGGAPTVPEGLDEIAEMVSYAQGRIEIIPAGGITESNITEIIKKAGCTQVHGTFSNEVEDFGYLEAPIRFAANDQLKRSCGQKIASAIQALTC